jgi:hypothetical protein
MKRLASGKAKLPRENPDYVPKASQEASRKPAA